MLEKILRDEARFSAVEYFVCRLWAAHLIASGKTLKDVENWKQGMKMTLQRQTFSKLDPAMSDAFAAELKSAVNALGNLVEDHLRQLINSQK